MNNQARFFVVHSAFFIDHCVVVPHRSARRADARQARGRGSSGFFFTSRSGTGSGRLCSAGAATSSFRAATCGRSIVYFPELHAILLERLPDGCVVDGEIVIATPRGLDFDALQMRLHPAASRVAMLAKETPAAFVAFDLLGGRRPGPPQPGTARSSRPTRTAACRCRATGSSHTRDRAMPGWPPNGSRGSRRRARRRDRETGRRRVSTRQARDDQSKARAHGRLRRRRISLAQGRERSAGGSLLLGLYDDRRRLHHVGVTSSFTAWSAPGGAGDGSRAAAPRHARASSLAANGRGRRRSSPRRECRRVEPLERWEGFPREPLRVERVCEVKYDHMQGDRFRHAAVFQRWRPDKPPAGCGYDQLEVTAPYESGTFSVRPPGPADPFPVVLQALVRIERLLRRPQRVGRAAG